MREQSPDREPLRVLIVDDHEVSRAACRALLRTEGLDVVADVRADEHAIAAARALRPDLAIVDVSPRGERGLTIARLLRALPAAPAVVLTSSAERSAFEAQFDSFAFLAKAEVPAVQLLRSSRDEFGAGERSLKLNDATRSEEARGEDHV